MSYTVDTLVGCPRLQARLNQLFAIPDPADVTTPSPALEFLLSDTNRGQLQTSISPGGGKIRTVRAVYRQRPTLANMKVNQPNPVCVATDKSQEHYTDYELDTTQNVQFDKLIDINDLINACTSNEMVLAEDVRDILNAIDMAVAQKSAVQMVALSGKYGSQVTSPMFTLSGDTLQVRTVKSTDAEAVAPFTMQNINTAAEMTAYTQPKVIVGGAILRDYAQRMDKGCCAEQGVDLGALFQQYRTAVMYDYWIQEAMGGQQYNLMMQSGALQMLWFNLFSGPNGLNQLLTPQYSQQVVVSRAGVPVDLMMKYDCGKLHIVGTATTKVVGLPSDMFPVGDLYTGVKWVNRIQVNNA